MTINSGTLLWTGLTLLVAVDRFFPGNGLTAVIGAVVMVVGLIMLWLNR